MNCLHSFFFWIPDQAGLTNNVCIIDLAVNDK